MDPRPVAGGDDACAPDVSGDAAEAAAAVAAGRNVVLVTPLPPPADPPADPPASSQGAGRLAVLVGDPDAPADRAAAAEMAAELFGRKNGPGEGRAPHGASRHRR